MMMLIFMFLKLNSYCHAMVFQAPAAHDLDFSKYALQNNQQTYTQWRQEQANLNSVEPHAQVIDFAQRILSGPKDTSNQLREDWAVLRKTIDLNSADREVLMLLAEKIHFKTEYCRYYFLNLQKNAETAAKDCARIAQPLSKALLKQLRPKDLLTIDGQTFNLEQIPKHLIPGSYQWTIVSNQYIDISFVGSAEEFAEQIFFREHWIEGSCDAYRFNYSNFTILSQAKIFFDKNCIQNGLGPEKTVRNWLNEHKKLVFAIGLIVGGLAVSHLKDKTLVITPQ